MLTKMHADLMEVERFQHQLNLVCGSYNATPVEGRRHTRGIVLSEQRIGLDIAHVAKDLQSIQRTAADCRRDSEENYFLIFQEEGSAMMAQCGTAQMLNPGDMILIDSTKASEFSFFGNYGRQLSVHLPRAEMDKRFGTHLSGGLFLPNSDHISLAIGAVLSKAFTANGNCEQNLYLRESLFGLIGVFLHDRHQQANFSSIDLELGGAQVLNRAMAFIDLHFGDSEITVPNIARELRVSMRQLQRAFMLLGVTPTDYLTKKRLEMACRMLIERRAGKSDLLVSSIAYQCGFNDVSYFNRVFRKVFSCAPGQYGEAAKH